MSDDRAPNCEKDPRRAASGHDDIDAELLALVRDAKRGDAGAWASVVRRFQPPLRCIARTYRLSDADIDDVVQTTWAQLVQHIDDIREPLALPGWLATTVRRQSLRRLEAHAREVPTDEPCRDERANDDGPEDTLLAAELHAALARALDTLPTRHRRLMAALVGPCGSDYKRAGAILDMPVGSIGPMRARSLERLRHHPELRELHLGTAA